MKDAFWIPTIQRWEREGLSLGTDLSEATGEARGTQGQSLKAKKVWGAYDRLYEHFGFDLTYLYIDSSMRFPEKLIEETDEHVIWEDKLGYTNKTYKTGPSVSTVGGYLDHKVKTREDWEIHRHRLQMKPGESPRLILVSYAQRFAKPVTWDDVDRRYTELQERELYTVYFCYGPYEATWRHHGFEETLIDMAAEPGLLSEMFDAHVAFVIEILEDVISRGLVPDGLFISEDIAYRRGPYFSPKTYRELLFPYHRKLGDFLRGKGIDFFMHSDGDMRLLIPHLIDAGFNVLQPLEVQCGMDVVELKQEYGDDLTFMGNISVLAMAGSRAEIEEEIKRKIPVAMKDGGYIFHSDHSVPPDVSWDNYQYVIELVHRYGTY
jgi:uroporphyrinogen decarboxylase